MDELAKFNEFLRDAIYAFRIRHRGKKPDYILVTEENFHVIIKMYHTLYPSLVHSQLTYDHKDSELKFQGIPMVRVVGGLKEDTIKLVIE